MKTVSGSVASWPATGNVTTRPLSVRELRQETNQETGEIRLVWEPNPESQQDGYKVELVQYIVRLAWRGRCGASLPRRNPGGSGERSCSRIRISLGYTGTKTG